MKQNYIDGKGVYHNELNLTLAQIYDSGVEFGCKVTAKGVIEELEAIKAEMEQERDSYDLSCINTFNVCIGLIDNHIEELKGETE